jgi:hypothetical protein
LVVVVVRGTVVVVDVSVVVVGDGSVVVVVAPRRADLRWVVCEQAASRVTIDRAAALDQRVLLVGKADKYA